MGGDMGRGSAMGRTDFAPSFGNANFLGKSQSTRIVSISCLKYFWI